MGSLSGAAALLEHLELGIMQGCRFGFTLDQCLVEGSHEVARVGIGDTVEAGNQR